MKRSELKEFIRQGVAVLQPSIEFGTGLLTDFNSIPDQVYPKVWLESPEVGTEYPVSAPLDTWVINIYIANRDKMDSFPDQYEDLIDSADMIAQRLIYQYRNIIENYKLTSLEGVKRVPWIKKNATCLTGIYLTFIIKNTDQTNVCP